MSKEIKDKEEDKIKKLEKQKEEYLNGWKKERADFLNYKKEEAERIVCLMKFANEELIFKFLEILDNIDIAEKKLPEELKDNLWIEGFLKIKTQVRDLLKKEGVEEIKCLGEKFNPNFQETVEEVEMKDKEPGIVIERVIKFTAGF